MKNKMVRVLIMMGGSMGYGGTEAFLMNYYRKMDGNIIQYDFVYQGTDEGVYDDEIRKNGGRIYYLPYKSRHPYNYTIELMKIIKENSYQIVYAQMNSMNAWPLWAAKSSGATVRISHSHSTNVQSKNFLKIFLNNIAKLSIGLVATDFWACSLPAGEWLYGKKAVRDEKVKIIRNAIDTDKLGFDSNKRDLVRKKYDLGDAFVIGHVGTLRMEKNHGFLINIFYEVQKECSNSKLLLVGDGVFRKKLEEQVFKLGIVDKVIFTGNQNNPSDFYNAMDVFVFPSLFEGLGIALLEAQANGLSCICSDTVPEEGYIADVKSLGLKEDIFIWRDAVLQCKGKKHMDNKKVFQEKGFDIELEAKKLQNLYINLYNRSSLL